MSNIYDQAHVLAKTLKASPEYTNYLAVKAKVDTKPELADMLNDLQEKSIAVQAQQMMGGGAADPEAMAQIQNLYGILMRDPLAMEYLQAEFAFSRMVSDVYKIIGDAVKGE